MYLMNLVFQLKSVFNNWPCFLKNCKFRLPTLIKNCISCSVLSFHLYEKPKCGWTANTTWDIVNSQLIHLFSNSKTSQFPANTPRTLPAVSQLGLQALPRYTEPLGSVVMQACTASFRKAGVCHCLMAEGQHLHIHTNSSSRAWLFCMPCNKDSLYFTATPDTTTADREQCKHFLVHWTEKPFDSKRVLQFLSHDSLVYSGY